MLKGAIARRYAQAIFEIGRKQNTLDRTLDDVQEIARLFAHRKLAYLLREPKIPVQRKETAIRQGLASKVLPTSLNLALLVVQRELVDLMQNIARELEQLVLDYKNQAIAEVTTATPMDEAQLALVKQALEQRTGKTILMQTNIQPAILGGVIARIGDQVIDGSVKHRLTVLQQQLLTGVASSSSADLLPAADRTEQPTTVVSNGRDTAAPAAVLTNQEPEADNVKQKQQAKPRRKQKK
jgi:F-type H+-transporting ATPase subunit delta